LLVASRATPDSMTGKFDGKIALVSGMSVGIGGTFVRL
jgi:hypothetical protein